MRTSPVVVVLAASILAPQHVAANPYDAAVAKVVRGRYQKGDASFTCSAIEAVLGNDVVTPKNSTGYLEEKEVNYSELCWLPAACFVSPKDVDQMSAAVRILGAMETTFSIRSGGKMLDPGFSSVDKSGVLLSLENFTELKLSADEKALTVGAGLLWGAVYEYVVPKGLVVLGGRFSQVGVTGLLLGGGISFYTNQYGLAIDSIKSFTIVLADGTVATASAEEHPDLYKALRGGNSNFGVIINSELYTYPAETLSFEVRGYSADETPAILEAYADFQLGGMHRDPRARVDMNIAVDGSNVLMLYNGPDPSPGVFDAFVNLTIPYDDLIPPTKGSYLDLEEIQAIRFSDPHVHLYGETFSHRVNKTFMVEVEQLFADLMAEPTAKYENFTWGWVPVAMPASIARDGNVLGVEAVEQQWHEWGFQWANDADNEALQKYAHEVSAKLVSAAEKAGTLLPYLFANTAGAEQKVLQSFGEKNVAFMKKVAQKYDPTSVFQRQFDGWLLRDV